MPESLDRLTAALADRYTIIRELGRGGMATVYLAEDVKHGRNVAIKVLKSELAAALGPERFLREIEISAGLDHPHILPLYEADHAENAEQWAEGARGVIALAEDRPEEALAAFRRFDDGNACSTCAYPWLARAYDQLGQEDSVRVMYEQFVELPSASLWYDGGHLAHGYVRLAEIHEGRGEVEEAIAYYGQFLSLWENADPEFQPWIEAANAAIRRLTGEPRTNR